MKRFRPGLPDYLLIALTCGLVLIAIKYLYPRMEDWFRAETRPPPGRDAIYTFSPITETAHD